MANTFDLISSSTVNSSGISVIEFNSITQTYTDLLIKASTRCSFDWLLFEFNNSGGTAYSQTYFRGDGNSGLSSSQPNKPAAYATITGQNVTANTFGSADIYISNYTNSNSKAISGDGVSEANQIAAYSYLTHSVWNNSAAITKIKITNSGVTDFAVNSTFYLYGISNS